MTMDPADDYPDFAHRRQWRWATAPRNSVSSFAPAASGICITANKVSGVRAGVAEDVETATIMRQHNDVNVLCLSGKKTSFEEARKILEAFLAAKFEGGRHERRVLKMDAKFAPAALRLRNVDPQVAAAIDREKSRQQENIELIASENFVSPPCWKHKARY